MYVVNEKDIFYYDNKILLVNYLTGACDVITPELAYCLEHENLSELDNSLIEQLVKRGTIFQTQKNYNEFVSMLNSKIISATQKTYPNFLLIPSYDCNLACPYCFEHTYEHIFEHNTKDWLVKSFNMIDEIIKRFITSSGIKYQSQKIIVTLMGGEPLLSSNKTVIKSIINNIMKRSFSYNIVTNGVNINEYLYIFRMYKPKSIQITLDGTKEYHDKRRIFHNGDGSFDKIIKNIHVLLKYNIPVSVRLNLDTNNLENIAPFIEYINSEFPNQELLHPYIYPMQDGGCGYTQNIDTELNYIKYINKLLSDTDLRKNFSFSFHGSEFVSCIKKNQPIKYKCYNCSAQNNQYIFDYFGNVYKCWFGVGNKTYSIFNQNEDDWNLNFESTWRSRTIFSIKECKICKYRYLCGGGCVNRLLAKGLKINQPNCVNFYDLIKEQLRII
ncbi:radical SAM/SPASM domain-containing protein [Mediterraneibacter gnavus]|uniref:radical SAM/SPASM domain-containing protein n=1 Tax=Mediterraneibacter gnavus TaxID=33038 RepID=UPI0034A0D9BE